jgi:hypothetical protein
MKALSLRSITACSLSLWLGVLACLMGCASPTKAARPVSEMAGVSCPERESPGDDSCCQRGHSPGNSEKSRHHSMSCCPTETALTQKQDLMVSAVTAVFVAVLTVVYLEPTSSDFTAWHSGETIPWQAGRDILREVHALRI